MQKAQAIALAGLFLAVVSVGLTAWAVFGRVEPLGIPFDSPQKVAYYRWTVALIVLAGLSGAFAVVLALWANQQALRTRWLSMGVAMLGAGGVLEAGFFLLVLTGLCGFPVLWGYCQG